MDDLNGKEISFKTDDGEGHVGIINWEMTKGRVSILYNSKSHAGLSEQVPFETDENTLRGKIDQGIWVLIE